MLLRPDPPRLRASSSAAYGAVIDIAEFVRLYWNRGQGAKLKIPKAMDAAFADPQTDEERRIKALIDAVRPASRRRRWSRKLFKQRKRLADAERTLQTKTTKAATESKRIATDKVEWALGKLADLRRTTLTDEDARIFPGWYAPVIVMEDGRRVRQADALPVPACRASRRPTTASSRAPTTRGATTWKDSGRGSSACRTGSWC